MELVVHGPIPPDSEAYVHRSLDDSVMQALEKEEYVNVGGGRQTGKTSLLFRLRGFLRDRGASSAYIDLSPLGETTFQEHRWYQGLGEAIRASLIPEEHRDSLPTPPTRTSDFQNYAFAVARTVRPNRPVVMLFDEVTAVPIDLRRPLFSTIRAMFNQRHDPASPSEARDILFVFAGSFDPDRIIEGRNSPFNVATSFDTSRFDFSSEQVRELATAVGLPDLTEEIFGWASGHPYLTNRLLQVSPDCESVEQAAQQLLAGDSNLAHLGRRLTEFDDQCFDLALRIRGGERIAYTPGLNLHLDNLMVIGLVKPNDSGESVIRCEIYSQFLDRRQALAQEQGPRQGADDTEIAFLPDGALKDHAGALIKTAPGVAVSIPALSVVCIGAAVETVLLLELERESDLSAEIQKLNSEVSAGRLDGSLKIQAGKVNPDDWTLAQMIEIARFRGLVSRTSSQVSHGLRAWRNLIHPAKLRQDYPDGVPGDLADASIANAQVLLREMRQRRDATK